MGYPTEYKPEGYGHPWQKVQDDHEALRLFIEKVTGEWDTSPAWIVTETGNGQRFTAFSDIPAAEHFADEVRAKLPEKGRHGGSVTPRVLVNKVAWPTGQKTATVISYLDDTVTEEDFILCLLPVPAVVYELLEFRGFSVGGVDDTSRGIAMPLDIDGDTMEGGW